MKTILKIFIGLFIFILFISCSKENENVLTIDYPSALKDTLNQLSSRSNNAFFKKHCESIIEVIEGYDDYTSVELDWIRDAYNSFSTENPYYGTRNESTYLNRNRPFVISWISPTDQQVSYAFVYTPKDWNPAAEYPLYISLHGAGDISDNPIKYLFYPYLRAPANSIAYEDGYAIIPWARGNLWYQGIAETDVWECISEFESLVNINPKRKYMLGHSMGGYGAWHFGLLAPDMWAAIGISIASIWYEESEITPEAVSILKDVPIYFMNGETDFNLRFNQDVAQMLIDSGNQNVEMVVFEGGHIVTAEGVENMYLWLRQFENE